MLNVDNNAKTVKGQKKGFLTAILYLDPNTDKSLCPGASEECRTYCLVTSGNARFPSVMESRRKKTLQFLEDYETFSGTLVKSLEAFLRKAAREGLTPTVRLNGTSDIPWHKKPVQRNGELFKNIFLAFPDVQFYDYTKVLSYVTASQKIDNWHVTFSYSGSNKRQVRSAIKKGANIAVVLNGPTTDMWGLPVVDGDEDDLRFLNSDQCVVGLKPKGLLVKAKTSSKFVLNVV